MKVLAILAVMGVMGLGVVFFLQPFIYSVIVRLYGLWILLGSVIHPKAKQWVQGRRNLIAELREHTGAQGQKTIWFHCSSLGEFEQGRPLIEAMRKEFPAARIVLTFFSPSGYTVRSNYTGVDHVTYMPLDTAGNAKAFLDALRPDMAVFIKYEFWYHHLMALHQRNIPTYLVSALFRKKQLFFRWFGRLHRTMLQSFTTVFVQDEASLKLMQKHKYTNGAVAFDTRFDRVKAIADQHRTFPEIEQFTEGFNIIVAGSTWPHDERIIARAMYKSLIYVNFKLIVAPHHIDARSIKRTMKRFKKYAIKYSELAGSSEEVIRTRRILIIDNMGLLSHLYRFGDVNYVGGGFNHGVHNTLEAAVHGKPVVIGRNYKQFLEARELVQKNAALVITDTDDLLNRINLMNQFPFVWRGVGDDAQTYVLSHLGGTETIMRTLRQSMMR